MNKIELNEFEVSDSDLEQYFGEELLSLISSKLNTGQFNEVLQILTQSNYLIDIKHSVLKQIPFAIHLFCLFRLKKVETVKNLFTNFNLKMEPKVLFPLSFLNAKLHFLQYSEVLKGTTECFFLVKDLEHRLEDDGDWECKIQFKYFDTFFRQLFSLSDTHSKIKKCYFEIKQGYLKLGLQKEVVEIFEKLSQRYPNDIIIVFEEFKSHLQFGSLKKTSAVHNKIKQINDQEKGKYLHIVLFCDYLTFLSSNNYFSAHTTLVKLMENNSGNSIVMNNIGLVNFYLNKLDKSYSDFFKIIDKGEMNKSNEISNSNLQLVGDCMQYIAKK